MLFVRRPSARFASWLLLLLGLLTAGTLLPSCELREDLVTRDPGAQLTTSARDTLAGRSVVRFDTVFTRRGSITKRFWVYNRNARAVHVDEIALVGAELGPTPYSLTIDGRPGAARRDFDLRGRDSLLVLVRVLIDPTDVDTTFLVQDSVRLRANGGTSYVTLRALGENAVYYDAPAGSNPLVACNSAWTARRPIVLLKTTVVDSTCTLTIEPGTRVYVGPGASLVVLGRLLAGRKGENVAPVKFRGLRRDDYYDDFRLTADPRYQVTGFSFSSKYANTPGQWGTIALVPSLGGGGLGTAENVLENCDIRNATVGVQISNPYFRPGHRVRIESCLIRNAYTAGVLGIGGGVGPGGEVALVNTVITNVGQFAVGAGGGGTYRLTYCTIAPEGPTNFRREDAALTFNDVAEISGRPRSAPIRLTIENSIVWSGLRELTTGGLANEVLILHQGRVPDSTLIFRNSLLQTTATRFNTDGATYNPNGAAGTLVLNQDPRFNRLVPGSPLREPLDLRLDSVSSAARNIGRPLPEVPRDLRNLLRSPTQPDAGAYEHL